MMTLAALRRRFLLLTFVRWLGPGLIVPVLVLVLTDVGLGLGQVGVVFAFYGATTALLELPTGGLADALGRRPVLVAGAVMFVLFDVILLTATSLLLLLVGAVVGGVGRALSSGPLEAWFVDAARRIDPDLGLRADLGRAGMLEGLALLVGALTSVLVTNLVDGASPAGVSVTDAPVAAAVIADVVLAVAIAMLVSETGRRQGMMRAAFGDVTQVVRTGIATARDQPVVKRLLIVWLLLAFGFVSIEVLWQPRIAELLGGPDEAARVAGLVVAAFALAAALGSGLASAVPKRLVDQPQRGATVAVVAAVAGFALMAATNSVWWFVAGIVIAYIANGSSDVFLSERLHDEIVDEQRATMLSVRSMTAQIANVGASLTIAPLAQVTSISVALLAGGGVMVLAAPVLLSCRSATADTPMMQRWAHLSRPWAPDHVPVDMIFGIPAVDDLGQFGTGNGILQTAYMTEEWGLPGGLVLLNGDGHWWIALDYRESGPAGPPTVVWVDVDRDEDLQLAESFTAVRDQLKPTTEFVSAMDE